MSANEARKKRWLPLEANPEIMEDFLRPLGFPLTAGFHDIYGLDDELLALVPRPVLAVLLLFPEDDAAVASKKELVQRIQKDGQTVDDKVWFTLQTVSNACGTIGLLHAVANNAETLHFEEGSYLYRFIEQTKDLTPTLRGKFIEEDTEMEDAHAAAASVGDSSVPDISAPVDLHFVAFVVVEGCLYELDGSKPFPVNHGEAKQEEILEASVRVVKKMMEISPTSIHFNLIALSSQ